MITNDYEPVLCAYVSNPQPDLKSPVCVVSLPQCEVSVHNAAILLLSKNPDNLENLFT